MWRRIRKDSHAIRKDSQVQRDKKHENKNKQKQHKHKRKNKKQKQKKTAAQNSHTCGCNPIRPHQMTQDLCTACPCPPLN